MMQRIVAIALVSLLMPTLAVAKERPGPGGRDLYVRECARCHGPEGRGDGPDAPFFSPAPRDLTTGFVERYDDGELLARLRDGEPLSLAIDPGGRSARARNVEILVGHLQRLPDIEWQEVDAGSLLFGERCEVCHGQFGKPWPVGDLPKGVQAPPRDLRNPVFQESTTDAQLLEAIRHGRRGMPAVPPALSDEEAAQLLAFVRVLSPGFESYSFYCAPCHGDDGRGRGILLPPGEGPKVRFDRAYLEAKDPEDLRATVWHMMDAGGGGMPHFKHAVDDESLRAIVEYLRNKQ